MEVHLRLALNPGQAMVDNLRVDHGAEVGGPDFPQMEPRGGLAEGSPRLFEGGVTRTAAVSFSFVRKTLSDRRLSWRGALRYKHLYNQTT